jgi:hypothetical protein
MAAEFRSRAMVRIEPIALVKTASIPHLHAMRGAAVIPITRDIVEYSLFFLVISAMWGSVLYSAITSL